MITQKTAQRIAADWHGGQWSQLYSFASTGKINTEFALWLIEEVIQEQIRPETALKPYHLSKKDSKDLASLREFLILKAKTDNDIDIRITKDFYGFDLPYLFASVHNVRAIKRLN